MSLVRRLLSSFDTLGLRAKLIAVLLVATTAIGGAVTLVSYVYSRHQLLSHTEEMLAAKIEAAAEAPEVKAPAPAKAAPRAKAEKGIVEQVVGSSVFKQFARSAGKEIVRSIFGTRRR